MKVDVQSVADKGNYTKERIVLEVLSDTDIGDYILFCTGYADETVTTAIRNTCWFPYKAVHKGDLVVLYTKFGRDSERTRKDGSKSHFFYWGLEHPIWQQENHAAVLLYAPKWKGWAPDEL